MGPKRDERSAKRQHLETMEADPFAPTVPPVATTVSPVAAALPPIDPPPPPVAVIIAAHNAAAFLRECLASIRAQTYAGRINISIHVDGATDNSEQVCRECLALFEDDERFSVLISSSAVARGAGPARNRAIEQCTAEYLCIQDADDVMEPERIQLQMEACKAHPDAIVGSRFARIPEDATVRYTRWCNKLDQDDLVLQRFRELTLIQPTWFMRRELWSRVGGYPETADISLDLQPRSDSGCLAEGATSTVSAAGPVLAEDLRFFYKHIAACEGEGGFAILSPGGGNKRCLFVVDKPLLSYRHSSASASWRTPRKLLFQIKAQALEASVLCRWDGFTIWGAGRDGKDLVKMISQGARRKVLAMCDIDPKKIQNGYKNPSLGCAIPVVHFSQAKPPLVCCVAMDRGGEFEANLASLGLKQGVDYVQFS